MMKSTGQPLCGQSPLLLGEGLFARLQDSVDAAGRHLEAQIIPPARGH